MEHLLAAMLRNRTRLLVIIPQGAVTLPADLVVEATAAPARAIWNRVSNRIVAPGDFRRGNTHNTLQAAEITIQLLEITYRSL